MWWSRWAATKTPVPSTIYEQRGTYHQPPKSSGGPHPQTECLPRLSPGAGEFVCDGPKLLAEALRWGAEITAVVAEEGRSVPCPPGAREGVRSGGAAEEPVHHRDAPGGAVPVQGSGSERAGQAYRRPLSGAGWGQDPGNVGTVWRTADAFGADGLILLPGCADPFSPKTVRATMGACFRLPVWEMERETLTARLTDAALPLYATALRADTEDVRRADLRRCAVVIGSEGKGFRRRRWPCADRP
ncbi:MAG: TrmH family RNA methyltransferase [Intestinimonas sp.]